MELYARCGMPTLPHSWYLELACKTQTVSGLNDLRPYMMWIDYIVDYFTCITAKLCRYMAWSIYPSFFFIPSYFIQPVSAKICYSYQRENRMRSMYFIISKIAMRTITRYYGKKPHTWKWLINRCRPGVGVTKQLSSAPVFSQFLE